MPLRVVLPYAQEGRDLHVLGTMLLVWSGGVCHIGRLDVVREPLVVTYDVCVV